MSPKNVPEDAEAHEGGESSQTGRESNRQERTPMYAAMHANRYQRQDMIREIERAYQHQVICHVCGNAASLDKDDTLGFVELLHNVEPNKDLDVLLHTRGGDIDAAEKLISMVRIKVGSGQLRLVVPDQAKSAGTLLALGADKIVMSDSSELGPIDPQIMLNDGHGNMIPHSVLHYLDAYDAHSLALRQNPNDVVARIMIGKLDPGTQKLFEAARKRARDLAEKLLRMWMFRTVPGNITAIASTLLDTSRWPSHGQVIGRQDAQDIGLLVEYLPPETDQWRMYWKLYCMQRLAIKDGEKLFESGFVSMQFEGSS